MEIDRQWLIDWFEETLTYDNFRDLTNEELADALLAALQQKDSALAALDICMASANHDEYRRQGYIVCPHCAVHLHG